jgi:hypothetical protein
MFKINWKFRSCFQRLHMVNYLQLNGEYREHNLCNTKIFFL